MGHIIYRPNREKLTFCLSYRDYLKFTLPLSYSLSIIAWGADIWFDGYQKANQVTYLRDMLKWGTDWLIQAHPNENTFYVQVGDGAIDNNYWGNG